MMPEWIYHPPSFAMTYEEVKYFLENIKHEYLSKNTYQESKALIERMERYLDDVARRPNSTTP